MAVKVEFSADAQAFLAAQQQLAQEQQKLRDEFKKTEQTSQAAERVARSVLKRGEDDAAKFRKQMDAVNKAFKDNRISAEEFRRAVGQLKDEYNQATQGSESLTASAGANVKQLVAGYLSVQTVLQTVNAAFRQIREEQERALEAQRAATPSSGLLGTLGDGEALRQQAREFFQAGATQTLEQANRLVFELASVGLQDSRRLFEQLGQAQAVENIQQLPSQLQQFRESFQGSGTAEEVLGKLLKAQEAANANLETLTRASSVVAPSATLQGFSDTETLAILAQLSRTQGIERAATNTASLFTSAQRLGITAPDTQSIVSAIREQVGQGGSVIDTLGSQEAVKAFTAIEQSQQQIADTLRAIQESAGGDIVQQRVQGNLANTEIANELTRRQAAARLQLTEQSQFGTRASAFEAIENAARAREARFGDSGPLGRFAAGFTSEGLQLLELITTERQFNQYLRDRVASPLTDETSRKAFEALLKSNEQTAENTKKQSKPAIPTPEAN